MNGTCTLDRCACPTCAVTQMILRTRFDVRDRARVTIRAADCASASYPYLASVRVDGREVYRIHARPDEVFEPDVLADITAALRRPM